MCRSNAVALGHHALHRLQLLVHLLPRGQPGHHVSDEDYSQTSVTGGLCRKAISIVKLSKSRKKMQFGQANVILSLGADSVPFCE